jgi:hypothetical protein
MESNKPECPVKRERRLVVVVVAEVMVVVMEMGVGGKSY